MTLTERQLLLIRQISSITDENVLIMLEEELSCHLNVKTDLTDELSQADLNELIALANEPLDKDIVSMDEFRKATDRWRTRS